MSVHHTVALSSLVQRGLLESAGAHKQTYYYFPGEPPADDPGIGFDNSSQHSEPSSQHSEPSSQHSDELENRAAAFRAKRRLPPAEVEAGLAALCDGRFLTLADLAALTGRKVDTLRNHYVLRMVHEGKLRLRYPENPTHPNQAYTKA